MDTDAIVSGTVARVSYVESKPEAGIHGRRIKLMLEGVYFKRPVARREVMELEMADCDDSEEEARLVIVKEFFVGFVLDRRSSRELCNAEALVGQSVRLRPVHEEGFHVTVEVRLVETIDLDDGPWFDEMPWIWAT